MPEGVGYDTLDPDKSPNPVNKPKGGTYGERADLDRLKQQLPQSQSPAPAGPAGAPPPPTPSPSSGGRGAPTPGPPGVPEALLAPTQSNQPVGSPLTPLPTNPVADAVGARQQRLAFYDQMANHPEVSQQTRDFYKMIIELVLAA